MADINPTQADLFERPEEAQAPKKLKPHQIRAAEARAAGLCMTCKAAKPEEGYVNCAPCRAVHTERQRKIKERLVAQGLCKRCQSPVAPLMKFCDECLRKGTESSRASYLARKASPPPQETDGEDKAVHRCRQCKNVSPAPIGRCDSCKAKRREESRRRVEVGGCANCAKGRPEPGYSVCKKCRDRSRDSLARIRGDKKLRRICADCPQAASPGRAFCSGCLAKRRDRYAALPKKQRFCRRCQSVPVDPGIKVCTACYQEKIKRDAATWRGRAIGDRVCLTCCKPCDDEKQNCSSCRAKNRAKQQAAKRKCMEGYGGRCGCCGETELCFLTIDHIHDDGAQHRKDNPHIAGGIHFYKYLIRAGFPKDVRCLCMNCQIGRRINNGVCPHESERLMKGQGEGI